MSDLQSMLLAALAGFGAAFLFSSFPGPVNLTILNEGAQRGFKWAVLIGLGASLMECVYCAVSFTGFSSFFEYRVVKAAMEVFSFVFLLFLGGKFLSSRTARPPTRFNVATQRFEARLGERLHPRSAFATGFVRVMGNLGVLLVWIVVATYFLAHDWVADEWPAKLSCVAGVALGTNTWFNVLSYGVSRGHGKFSETTLMRMQRVSGVCLLAAGLYGGIHVVWQLAKHKI
jgi:threonine/homoserine/homoserine lactone efflux protein